jgi:hypothetical protein
MKKHSYIILTALFLSIFALLYHRERQAAAVRETAALAEKQAAERQAAAEKDAEARKSREDAARRAAERDAAQKQKELEKETKWRADLDQITAETKRHTDKAARQAAALAALESKLADLRRRKQAAAETLFATEKENELLSIERRNNELELQRVNEIIARRAAALLAP